MANPKIGPINRPGPKTEHILSNIDYEARRGDCIKCGPGMMLNRGDRASGGYRWACSRKRPLSKNNGTKHVLSNIDAENFIANCSFCGPNVRIKIIPRLRNDKFYCVAKGIIKHRDREFLWGKCEHCDMELLKPLSTKTRRRWCDECCPHGTARRLLYLYDLAWPEREAMYFEQDGNCLICGIKEAVAVDHDHSSGAIRGLLCHSCNTTLSYLERPNWANRANAYLRGELI